MYTICILLVAVRVLLRLYEKLGDIGAEMREKQQRNQGGGKGSRAKGSGKGSGSGDKGGRAKGSGKGSSW